ncbi:MAG: D-alanyl-D-alanine carboxypeptidase [Chloroflexi bacterium]|nr:MAG: D-alanyl-D-alanine carboxypeptidase [Chloroflexota bacterium]
MRRSVLHLTAVLVAIGALSSGLGSAAPRYQASASEPPTGLTAIPEVMLGPRPDRVPVSTPTPMPSPAGTVKPLPTRMPRPAATLRPLPVPVIAAQEVTLVNLDTGRFLWQSNARAARAPASLTKIFTAMVAVDLIGMNTTVTVPASISQLPADSTFMGLTAGERLTVRELLDGVFLNSGNDAAETLASAVTSRSSFIAAMNTKAARLGLRGTHFENPSGLDAAGHYSSAYDLALAAVYLESHYPALVAIAATPALTIPATSTHKAFALVNINKLLRSYPGAYGLKTGWTEAALGCLITTSSRGGHRLLAVMLGAPNGTAYAEMPKVLDYGFELLGVLPRPAAS